MATEELIELEAEAAAVLTADGPEDDEDEVDDFERLLAHLDPAQAAIVRDAHPGGVDVRGGTTAAGAEGAAARVEVEALWHPDRWPADAAVRVAERARLRQFVEDRRREFAGRPEYAERAALVERRERFAAEDEAQGKRAAQLAEQHAERCAAGAPADELAKLWAESRQAADKAAAARAARTATERALAAASVGVAEAYAALWPLAARDELARLAAERVRLGRELRRLMLPVVRDLRRVTLGMDLLRQEVMRSAEFARPPEPAAPGGA